MIKNNQDSDRSCHLLVLVVLAFSSTFPSQGAAVQDGLTQTKMKNVLTTIGFAVQVAREALMQYNDLWDSEDALESKAKSNFFHVFLRGVRTGTKTKSREGSTTSTKKKAQGTKRRKWDDGWSNLSSPRLVPRSLQPSLVAPWCLQSSRLSRRQFTRKANPAATKTTRKVLNPSKLPPTLPRPPPSAPQVLENNFFLICVAILSIFNLLIFLLCFFCDSQAQKLRSELCCFLARLTQRVIDLSAFILPIVIELESTMGDDGNSYANESGILPDIVPAPTMNFSPGDPKFVTLTQGVSYLDPGVVHEDLVVVVHLLEAELMGNYLSFHVDRVEFLLRSNFEYIEDEHAVGSAHYSQNTGQLILKSSSAFLDDQRTAIGIANITDASRRSTFTDETDKNIWTKISVELESSPTPTTTPTKLVFRAEPALCVTLDGVELGCEPWTSSKGLVLRTLEGTSVDDDNRRVHTYSFGGRVLKRIILSDDFSNPQHTDDREASANVPLRRVPIQDRQQNVHPTIRDPDVGRGLGPPYL